MPIKVIGAGLGRTGTLSLKMALEELGFVKCYHMTEVLANLEHVRAWDAAARGETIDWEALFQGYQATVDWPGCTFYEELMRRYPEAKVVLSVRDPERWYDSALKTIYYVRHAFPRWMPLFYHRMNDFHRMLDRLVWDGMFLGRFEDKAFAIEVFNRYNEQVRRVVPPDRLLVFEVREGWQPLCAFLGVPVPAGKPFPHVNDVEEFRSRIQRASRIVRTIGYTVVTIVALTLVWLASRFWS
jgi:sulfotransferase family protein